MFIFQLSSSAFSQDQFEGSKNGRIRAVNPLYDLRVTNFQPVTLSSSCFNEVYFDFYIYHTNPADSGPFEFAEGRYALYIDPTIANGGTLTYSMVPNSTQFTNPNAVPVNASVVGNELRLSRNANITSGNGPIVSAIYPGTRIVTVKLSTTAPCFSTDNFTLTWINPDGGGDSYTEVYGYIDGVRTNLSNNSTLIIDSTQSVLPVELSGFSAEVNKNNVSLNWSTSEESNNSGFEIERSVSGNLSSEAWTKAGFVNGNGTSSATKNYSFTDRGLLTGIYKYRLKQIDYNGNYQYYDLQSEVVIGIPAEFSLKQNYPNPFNPTTKISFDIKNDAFVSLKLFDMNGKEIKTLVNEFKNSGYYSIDLDASELSSGAYFYRIESGNFISTKKLVVLR